MSLSLPQVIAAIVNFFLLLALLKVFLYKPVFNMLDARKNEIQDNLSAAEKAREEARDMREKYEMSLKEANTKAQSIIQEASDLGEKTRAEILAQARQEAVRVTEKAKDEIEREKEQALKDLRYEVANLALDAAEKVVGRTVTVADHNSLVDEFIKEAGEAK